MRFLLRDIEAIDRIIKANFYSLTQVRSVDVYRTVFELKTKLESMVKIPANRMRLFYVDQVSSVLFYVNKAILILLAERPNVRMIL